MNVRHQLLAVGEAKVEGLLRGSPGDDLLAQAVESLVVAAPVGRIDLEGVETLVGLLGVPAKLGKDRLGGRRRGRGLDLDLTRRLGLGRPRLDRALVGRRDRLGVRGGRGLDEELLGLLLGLRLGRGIDAPAELGVASDAGTEVVLVDDLVLVVVEVRAAVVVLEAVLVLRLSRALVRGVDDAVDVPVVVLGGLGDGGDLLGLGDRQCLLGLGGLGSSGRGLVVGLLDGRDGLRGGVLRRVGGGLRGGLHRLGDRRHVGRLDLGLAARGGEGGEGEGEREHDLHHRSGLLQGCDRTK